MLVLLNHGCLLSMATLFLRGSVKDLLWWRKSDRDHGSLYSEESYKLAFYKPPQTNQTWISPDGPNRTERQKLYVERSLKSMRGVMDTLRECRKPRNEGRSYKAASDLGFSLCVTCPKNRLRVSCWRYLPPVPIAHGLMYVPANPPFISVLSDTGHLFPAIRTLSKPTHPFPPCSLVQDLKYWARELVLKCAVFWLPATSMCADPKATSWMRSPLLRKHPSHRRHGPAMHRKLWGCMHVHTCRSQSLRHHITRSINQLCMCVIYY